MADKLGILAGGGDLPRQIIAGCKTQGRPFFVVAFEGQTDPETVEGVPHTWVRLGAAGKTIKCLRTEGATELTMAGRISRPSIASIRPDWWAARFLARTGATNLGDDGLLSALVRELETREGFRIVGVETLLPDLLAESGVWTRIQPDDAALRDIERGLAVARVLGGFDVGQAVVVQQGLILGLEAIEGTDALLKRCAELRREGPGGVLVKIRKPGQETRADLPTIGETTIRLAAAAGLRGVFVEAGWTVVLNREAVVRAADDGGLFAMAGPAGEGTS